VNPAAALVRRLIPIPEGPQRAARLERELLERPAGEAVEILTGLMDHALVGGRDLWLVFAHEICKRSFDYPWIRSVYEAAADQDSALLRAVLLAGDEPRETAGEGSFAPPDAQIEGLTLGHRKSLARSAGPELLEKLATDADPSVIEIWLRNPRTTERPVVRLAAARPNRPEVLTTIAREWKWFYREPVRSALASNPYVSARVAAAILPSLPLSVVRPLASDPRVHPRVSEVASGLLRRRTPPEPTPPDTRL
jgi:hypothetical protein